VGSLFVTLLGTVHKGAASTRSVLRERGNGAAVSNIVVGT